MSNFFDTEINEGLHANTLDTTTMAVSDIVGGGAVATVVDIGASLWNSLPGTPEVDTADLLNNISTNALNVYTQNPDAIHAASFVGGMFIPMGVASKGLQLMRAGSKGASWFHNADRAADMSKLAKAVDETRNYRDITRAIYAKTAVNQAVDAVAMELAFVGMMNAHPFMEDYMKDLPTNFALSAMLGGGLGAGVGVIAERFAIKAAMGNVAEGVLNDVTKAMEFARPDMTSALKLQAHETSIKNLDEILSQRKALGKNETNDLTFATAQSVQLNIKAEQTRLFEEIVSDGIKALPVEKKDPIMRLLIEKPEMLGAEEVRFFTEKELTARGMVKAPKFPLHAEPDFIKNSSKVGPVQPKAIEAVYFPELGLYGARADAVHYAGAASLNKSKAQLQKEFLAWNSGKIPDYETGLELMATSSAHAEAKYIAAWEKVANMSEAEFKNLHIADSDGPFLNAVLYRIMTDPKLGGATVKVSNDLPVMKQIVKEHVEKMVQEGKISAEDAIKQGPDAVYQAKLDKLGKEIDDDFYMPGGRPGQISSYIPGTPAAMIRDWISGDKMQLNRMAVDHLASETGGFAKSGVNQTSVMAFEKIYNSAESKALRAKFMELADHDGFVYLYRGWRTNKIKGQQPLDSFTTHYKKAAQFVGGNTERGVKLYKVPVDDIVAGFGDVGGGAHNAEIIVRASARTSVAELSSQGKMVLKDGVETFVPSKSSITTTTKTLQTKETIAEGMETLDAQGLTKVFLAQKQAAIDGLLNAGIPMESIAIKTNTDLSVVKAYALVRQQGVGLDMFNVGGPFQLNKIKKYEDIDTVLAPTNQPLVLSSNLKKNPLYIQNRNALDNKHMRELSKTFMSFTMAAAKSETVKALDSMFYGPEGYGKVLDIIQTKIGAVNNERAGSAFFNSFDFFTRNMADVGPAVSAIGKEIQRVASVAIKKVMEPIEHAMVAVQKDATALVEFSTFYNVNASLKGWRGLDGEGYLVQKTMKVDTAGKNVEVLERVKYTAADGVEREYRVATASVRSLIDQMQAQSSELRELSNTINRIKGTKDVSDIGLWIPSFNPVDKFIAYVHNSKDQTTKLLWAKTEKEYRDLIKAYKEDIAAKGQTEIVRVVTRDEQADWNLLNGRLDPIHMERADIQMQKGGSSAAAIVKPDIALFGEIARGYEFYITSQVRNLADLNMHEITDTLHQMSQFNRRFVENQPFSEIKKVLSKPKDAAAIIRNTLLGGTNVGEYQGWQSANRSFETFIGMASNTLASAWNETIRPISRSLLGKKKEIDLAGMKKVDYQAFNAKLEAAGVIYPWKGLDEEAARKMGYFNIENADGTSKRLVYGGNALAATMALRFGEIAQPLVNAMSLPILTSLAIAQKMPETFMGVQKQTASVYPTQIMYEGIRAMNSPHFKALNKRWEETGAFAAIVSEASDVMRATRKFDKGAIAAVENALDSTLVNMMSKPADYAETLTRKITMNTGAVLAKRLYPELDDVGVTIFARDFMDKAIGNFHAAQRPVLYQGTLGVALGLFQTYMWTMGQSVYRHLELKNYKALAKTAALQSTIFGTSSLPGFDQVSAMIGDKFSDDNVDLVTGTYRATGDDVADFILYGLPSNLPFMGTVSTRGDINPRFPNALAGLDNIVAVNFAAQSMTMMGEIKRSLNSDNPDMARAFGQALSLQSMSRPIARGAELATGYSITRQGNTVQIPEEVWSFNGIAARLMSTRPIEEQKLRDADHLNHFYGSLDRDARQEVTEKLRTSLRNGTLDDEKLSQFAELYFRKGGSPTGWRSAVNNAIARTNEPGREVFIEKLKPDNPLNFMINNLD